MDDELSFEDGQALLGAGKVLPDLAPAKTAEASPAVRAPRRSSRFQTLNAFVDHSAKLVSTTAQAAWLVLFRDVKPNGIACMSYSQIAQNMGVSTRTAIRAVKELNTARLVTVTKQGGLNRGSSAYRVHGRPM